MTDRRRLKPTPEQSECFRLLKDMTSDERGDILCWFCAACFRYVGPGDWCHCEQERVK